MKNLPILHTSISVIFLLTTSLLIECSDSSTYYTFEDAKNLIFYDIFNGDTSHINFVRVSHAPGVLSAGTKVCSHDNEYFFNEHYWFFFIDDFPPALFAHDCRYVFVSVNSGRCVIIDEDWFPVNLRDDLVVTEFE